MEAQSRRFGILAPAACLGVVIGILVPDWATAADTNVPTTARGNEPGWSLTIGDSEIDLITNMGADRVTFAKPRAEVTTRYVVEPEGVVISIVDTPCADTMSGMPFPFSVTVERPDGVLSGCGGEPASLLTGDEWTVESIGGQPTVPQSKVTIAFAEDGGLSGAASCNRFVGGWHLSGEGLTFGQIGSTMMACLEPELSDQERTFIEALGKISRFEIAPDGALVLVAGDTPAIVARR